MFDLTIAPVLCDLDVERLRKARCVNGNPVLVDVLTAAIAIDMGEFRRAQLCLLDAINSFTADGTYIPDEAHALVDTVRKGMTGHRFQICALRSCLDLVDALHLKCRPQAAGERIGHLCQALSELIAAQTKSLRKAA